MVEGRGEVAAGGTDSRKGVGEGNATVGGGAGGEGTTEVEGGVAGRDAGSGEGTRVGSSAAKGDTGEEREGADGAQTATRTRGREGELGMLAAAHGSGTSSRQLYASRPTCCEIA